MRVAATFAALLLSCATSRGGGPPAAASLPGAPLGAPALAAGCARGLAADCRTLGRARLVGEGLPRDDRLAASDLMQACELGDPAACGDLGVLFAIGRGLAQSDERAAALSRRSCEQGGALACSNHAALLAEGAVPQQGGADGPEPRSGRIVRLFRTACEAAVPEGCLNLGTALEGGELAVRDLPAAGKAYRRACAAGVALACHRLALVLAERPEVAPDLAATALAARSCRAGIAPACFAVAERTPPETARTPAARLVDERGSFALGIPGTGGFSPGELTAVRAAGAKHTLEDVRRPPEALRALVPEALRARLGVDLPPRPVVGGDPAVERLLELRRPQLGQCYEAGRRPAAPAADVYAVLFVDGDGRAREVRAASSTGEAALESCVAELVASWEFPASPDGMAGPYLVRSAFDAAPASPPAYAGPDALRPSLRDPGCVERGLTVPGAYRETSGSVTVKLAVDRAGAPGLVHALTPVPDPILVAVTDALARCAWSPGADGDGRPATLWVTLTVNLPAR